LPQEPGIYQFLDKNRNILYVGKAKNLKKRVSSYFRKNTRLLEKTAILVAQTEHIKAVPVESEIEALLLEVNLIKKNKPKYNILFTDSKSYPSIKITKEEYPKILVVRKTDDKKAVYFGPFPSAPQIKSVVTMLRKIFPYQSVVNHPKRFCLYYYLDLCPCPPMFIAEAEKKEYKKSVLYITSFLKGKCKRVLSALKKERKRKAEQELFEEASRIQKQIEAIQYITSAVHKPFEYETNPNLHVDLRKEETDALLALLQKNGVGIDSLARIECFDISTLSGIFSTGGMVVFVEGKKNPLSYKRFRIKREQETQKPNDFAMMEEVLRRRIKHTEWPFPNLIIVDGGKGQVSSALSVLKDANKKIPIIGLAKREETIITSDFRQVLVPKNTPSFRLITRIRDETHRFAITYHRKLRSKAFLGTYA